MPSMIVLGMGVEEGEGSHPITLGLGTGGTIVMAASSLDARTLELVFNVKPVTDEALDPANYEIAPDLEVEDVEYVTDFHFRLKTARQSVDELYMLTLSNINPA